jgi:hypothetical protein
MFCQIIKKILPNYFFGVHLVFHKGAVLQAYYHIVHLPLKHVM